MTDAALPFPVATLLAERPWVRGVARALVRDDAAADDLAQDVWVAALTHEGEAPHAPRGWFATVLRRSASKGRRSAQRREARERVVARPEATASTFDVVAQAEWHRRVVDAVLALDEPYRTAVLLRFFEDLPPREVALRTGAPVATVRSRVQRGLERLREAFDRGHGGDRRAWAGALVALAGNGTVPGFAVGSGTGLGMGGAVGAAGPKGSSGRGAAGSAASGTTAVGGALMATKGKAVLVAAIVALIGGGLWGFMKWQASRPSTIVLIPVAQSDGGAGTAPPSLAAAGGLGAGPAATGMTEAVPPPPPESTKATVEPRIRFRSGAVALTGEEARTLYENAGVDLNVVLVPEEELTGGMPARTYARLLGGETQSWQHRFSSDWLAGEPKLHPATVEAGRWWAVVSRPALPPAFVRADSAAAGGLSFDVDLRPSGRATRVRFVDPESKEAIPGVRVVPYVEFGDDAAFIAGSALVANDRGEVDLPLAEPGEDPWRPVSWWALAQGRAAIVPPSWATANRKEAVLEVLLPRTATVQGRAWGHDGKPAVGATVAAMAWKGYGVSTTVMPDGRYVLAGVVSTRAGEEGARITLLPNGPALDASFGQVEATAGHAVSLDLGAPADSATKAGALRGRLTVGGRPVPGALILLGRNRIGSTASDGTFRFEGLRADSPKLMLILGDARISDDGMLSTPDLNVPEDGADVVLDLDLPDGAIRVRVLDDATGTPVAGAWVIAGPEGEREDTKRFPGLAWKIGWSGVTDADGVAWMRGLPPDARFRLGAKGAIRTQGTAEATGVVAGTGVAPTEATLRLVPRDR